MSYMEGEGVIDYSYSEEDVFKTAKSHIRTFIEVIIGVVIGFGLLTILCSSLLGAISCLGGCLGCEACIETAACADECGSDCMDCDFEAQTMQNVIEANERVSCEGIDCFGREGCFSCGGCGDCSTCKGVKYYTIKTSWDGEVQSRRLSDAYIGEGNYFNKPSHMDTNYFQFLGYFDKAEGGTQYVDASGYIVKTLKDGMTLYPQYQERGRGQLYEFVFDLSAAGVSSEYYMTMQVGDVISGFPTAPTVEGYTFKGWYVYVSGEWKLMYSAQEANPNGTEFHLYDFDNLYNSGERQFMVRAEYAPNTYVITFVLDNSTYTVEAKHNETFGSVAAKMEFMIPSEEYGEFFGWGPLMDSLPADAIKNDTLIKKSMTVYGIFHEAINVRFYLNLDPYDTQYMEEKYYEGETNVKFPKPVDASLKPGYEFKGWYTSRTPSIYDQPIDGTPSVTPSLTREYYAKWEKATYTLEYYYTTSNNPQFTFNYEMQDTAYELLTKDDVNHKVGYEFVGWCENSSLTDTPKTELSAGTYGNKKLYAKYEAENYTFTLVPAGGALPSGTSLTSTVSYGSSYKLPAPTREGYNFVGWYCGDTKCTDGKGNSLTNLTLSSLGYTDTVTDENNVNNRATLIAKWEIKTFIVSFISDGKNHINPVTVEWNTSVSKPAVDPYMEGHTFAYWTYKGNQFNFANKIQEDITLIAKFNINRFTVIAIVDGTPKPLQNVAWGTTIEDAVKNVTIPDKNGVQRRFIGWYDAPEGGNAIDVSKKITGTCTIYTRYQQAELFTFHKGNDGELRQYYFVGDTVDFPVDEMRGYQFDGWYTTEDFRFNAYLKNVQIYDSTPTTYYAKHTIIPYTISYYVDGSFETSETYTISNAATALRGSVFNDKPGYDFVGWKLDNKGATILELPANTIGDQAAYAQFTPKTYTVTLNNAAEDAGENDEKQVTFDAAFNLGTSSKEGYDFNGWSWSQNGELITDNTGKSLETYTIADDATAYPVFTLKKYTATWKTPDGALYNDTTTITHFDPFTRPAIDPSVEGYTFNGWYADTAFTTEYTFDGTVTGDITVYAKFTINQYTLTVQISELENKTFTIDYATGLSHSKSLCQSAADAYARENNKRFKAWVSEDGSEYTSMPAYDLVLKATYYTGIAVEWYLTADENELPVHTSVVFEGEMIYRYNATRNGYTFTYWYTSQMLYENTKASFPMTAVETWTSGESAPDAYKFYGDWTPNTYHIHYYIDGAYWQGSSYDIADTTGYGGFALMQPEARDGYEFVGWYSSPNYSGDPISAIDNSEGVNIYGDLYLYGRYELEKYTITFVSNGVELTEFTKQVTYGETITGLRAPTNGSSTFLGYALAPNTYEFVVLNNGGSLEWVNITYQFQDDITLYAVWG